MSDTPRLVTGVFRSPSGQVYPNKTIVIYRRNRKVVAQGSSVVVDEVERTTLNAQGEIEVSLLPGAYLGRIALEDADRYFEFGVPEGSGAYSIEDAIENASPFIEPASVAEAQAARDKAREWAESATAPGAAGTKSSKTWAAESAASAATALSEANRADTEADRSQAEADRAEGFANGVDPAYGRVTYFVSNSGSDTANGITPATAFRTLAKAAAVAQSGDVVRLRRNGKWRETLSLLSVTGVTVEDYGAGSRPVISGLDVISSFTIDGAGPAYNFTIDLPIGTTARAYAGVIEDGKRLREYRIGAGGLTDNAGVIAAVQANPGSFGFLSWSTNPTAGETGGWTAGTKTYIVHASDGGNPNSNGKVYEAYKRADVLRLGAGCLLRNIVVHQGWRHEVGDLNDVKIEGCAFLYQARHGTLPPNRVAISDTLVGLSNPQYPGGLFHLQATVAGVTEPPVSYRDVIAIGDPNGFAAFGLYNHGISGGTARIAKFAVDGARVENVNTVYEFGVADEVRISGLVARNFSQCGGAAGVVGTITHGDWRSRSRQATPRRQWNISQGQTLNLRDAYVDVVENSLFRRETGQNAGVIDIRNSTLILRDPNISSDVSGLVVSEDSSTRTLAGLTLLDSIYYGPGQILSRFASVADLGIDRVLVIGRSARGNTTQTVGGVTSEIAGRVIGISDTKAVASDGYDEGLKLRQGVYQPGDEIFSAVVGSPFADNPRAYVAVGDSIMTTSGTNGGTAWTKRATPGNFLRAVALSLDKAIAVGDAGEIWRTTDSFVLTWVQVTGTGITDNLLAVAGRSTGVVIAVGAGGVIWRSADFGATWTSIASPTTRAMRAITLNGDAWVAAGDEGRVIRSTDNGLTWTEATVGTAAHRAIARFNSLWVLGSDAVLGSTSLTSNIRTSADAVTWTERANGVPNSVRSFAVTPEGLVAGVYQISTYSAASFMTSTDGTTWVVEDTVLPFEVTGLAATGASGRFEHRPVVAVGESGHCAVRRANGHGWDIRRISQTLPSYSVTGHDEVITAATV